MIQFMLYAARWQLSTPILGLVTWRLGVGWKSAAIANLIGSCIFFWVDRWIFG